MWKEKNPLSDAPAAAVLYRREDCRVWPTSGWHHVPKIHYPLLSYFSSQVWKIMCRGLHMIISYDSASRLRMHLCCFSLWTVDSNNSTWIQWSHTWHATHSSFWVRIYVGREQNEGWEHIWPHVWLASWRLAHTHIRFWSSIMPKDRAWFLALGRRLANNHVMRRALVPCCSLPSTCFVAPKSTPDFTAACRCIFFLSKYCAHKKHLINKAWYIIKLISNRDRCTKHSANEASRPSLCRTVVVWLGKVVGLFELGTELQKTKCTLFF